MEKVRVSRRFTFECAHALLDYDGACRHIHGHSYKLEVCLMGKPLKEAGHPKNGMVIDFGELKQLVQETIIADWDHSLLLNREMPVSLIEALQENEQKLVLLPFQPSCENMLLDIRQRLQEVLPQGLSLCRLMLSETENSFAEWYAADNVEAG